MRKNITFKKNETEYYCDICKEKIEGYSTMGSITYPDELLDRCDLCGKEVCVKCRGRIPVVDCNCHHGILCNNCLETHKDTIEEIKNNIAEFNKNDELLRNKIFAHRTID